MSCKRLALLVKILQDEVDGSIHPLDVIERFTSEFFGFVSQDLSVSKVV